MENKNEFERNVNTTFFIIVLSENVYAKRKSHGVLRILWLHF